MRILQLCAVDFTLYHFLLPLMRGLRDAGHEVTGACAHGNLVPKIEAEGFRMIDVPIRRSANPLALWRSYRTIKHMLDAEKFDMVHVHTPVAALAGRLAAWQAGVPKIVYTAHGFYFHEHMPWPKRFAHIGLEWIAGRTTDLLLTQAEEDAATARSLGLAHGPIHAIGNGSDPARFRPALPLETTRADIRASLGTPQGRPVILMVGRLVAEKGYPELVEAMRAVDAELWIVGARLASDHADGVDAALHAAENDPVLKTRIRLLGYRSDVHDLLRAADIFTLPSHREGMPRSIIEAMLSGLPVVATDIRGSREAIVHGQTGFLVPVRDPSALATALSRLADNAALRTGLGAVGLARARDLYDEAQVVARQLALLAALDAN